MMTTTTTTTPTTTMTTMTTTTAAMATASGAVMRLDDQADKGFKDREELQVFRRIVIKSLGRPNSWRRDIWSKRQDSERQCI